MCLSEGRQTVVNDVSVRGSTGKQSLRDWKGEWETYGACGFPHSPGETVEEQQEDEDDGETI